MPDVDGIELLRHVRQDDSLGSVPVVSKCSQCMGWFQHLPFGVPLMSPLFCSDVSK